MTWRFFVVRDFHGAGGEACLGEGTKGEEEGEGSREVAGGGCSRGARGEEQRVRSSVSIGGEADLTRRRGEVRRVVGAALKVLGLGFEIVSLVCEEVDEKDVFDVMACRAGRVLGLLSERRDMVVGAGGGCVRSKVSISFSSALNWRAGIDATPARSVEARDLVGVPAGEESVHAFNVVCLLGDTVTDFCRAIRAAGAFFVDVIFDFLAGNWDGEGKTDELTRSSMSIVLGRGGVSGRFVVSREPTGSVRDR
jgi:hypothetical protein